MVIKSALQPLTGPLTKMQRRTTVFPLRPSLRAWFTAAVPTITRFSTQATNQRRPKLFRWSHFVKFDVFMHCQSRRVKVAGSSLLLLLSDSCSPVMDIRNDVNGNSYTSFARAASPPWGAVRQ